MDCTYCMCLDITVDDFHRDRVHWDATRAVYKAMGYDSLGVDPRKRFWCIVGKNRSSWIRHLD